MKLEETNPAPTPETPPPCRGGWFWCRRGLKWCGHGAWIFAALLLYAGVHLNQIGVPDFLKRPLLEQLRERGAELEFSRMRVRLGRGLVIENVNLSRTRESVGEVIYAGQLQLKLAWRELLSFRAPQIVAVTLSDGRFTLPLETGAGTPPFPFQIEQVEGRLRFDGPEVWTLERLEAKCHGGRFTAAGTVANASLLRRRSAPKPRPIPESVRRELLRVARALDRMTFSSPPDLKLTFTTDLARPEASTAVLQFAVAGAQSDLGKYDDLKLSLEAHPTADTNGLMALRLRLESAAVTTRWAKFNSLDLDVKAAQSLTNIRPTRLEWSIGAEAVETHWARTRNLQVSGVTEPVTGDAVAPYSSRVTVKAAGVHTEWASATNAVLESAFQHSLNGAITNWLPAAAEWSVTLDQVGTRWGDAATVTLSGEGRRADQLPTELLPVWWGLLAPFEFNTRLAVTNFATTNLAVDRLALGLTWGDGRVEVKGLRGHLYGGDVNADVRLEVASREAQAEVFSNFDLHRLEPLMTTNAVKWIRQYGWRPEQPVEVRAAGRAQLPAWTNRHPNWRREVLPTLEIAGTAIVTNFTFRGLPGDRAFAPFTHTNLLWSVRQAKVWRPEGEVELDYEGHTGTQDYHFHVRSSVDPNLVRPLLEAGGQKTLDSFEFTQPPHVEGDIWGRWFARERIGFQARLSATNFVFRGEQVDEVRGAVAFTNQFVDIRDVDLKRGATWAQVPTAGFDVAARRLWLTNATATLDVAPVTRVIGPKTHAMMQAYQFAQPLRAVVNGLIPIGNPDGVDLTFDGTVGGFSWWRLNATNASAFVRWQGDHLTITNLDAGFHGGRVNGEVWINSANKDDVQFGFDATGREMDLPSLLRDLLPSTNKLEGTVTGRLKVDRASSRDDGPWQGSGDVKLRDGFLWGLPVFGVLSSALEGVSPGLGRQRFSEGSATFTLTNRVIRSKDLELKSPAMRLKFEGDVGFDGRLDSRMEAELLRDVPIVGPVISLVLMPFTKLFEFDVQGSLGKPEAELRHVPSFFLAPLRPIHTLRTLFPDEPVKPESELSPAPVPTPEPAPERQP
jgi:hypothetical protein